MKLRFKPKMNLSDDAVKAMLKERMFFDAVWNKQSRGLRHDYKSIERNGAKLVIDHATGLTWQQGGSDKYMTFAAAKKYIAQLNHEEYREEFAGYNDWDWRLPTLEEAMSVMEPEKKNGDLYIDPAFDKNQRRIWTADNWTADKAWCIDFYYGGCFHYFVRSFNYVRAVRSGQS